MEQVILVNEKDEPVGTMEKMEAHRNGGHLHRAFSVFIFNSQQKMLLQQRSSEKYHSGGLWTNTCCSHPYPDEETGAAAQRRLQQEMGFATPVYKAFAFTYKAPFANGLTEWEYDHVFVGHYNGPVQPNPAEVKNYCYQSIEEIKSGLQLRPGNYTEWFKIAMPKLEAYLQEKEITD
jgi:isopentenyl-diphosphate Delta-isomerase